MLDVEKYIIKKHGIIKINSQEIKKGDIFVALLGSKVHGNKFISDAFNNGAKYIITDVKPNKKLSKLFFNNIILVENISDYLLSIAKIKRNLFLGKVIGITGSVGKTSVKENLNFFLSNYFSVSASIKSYNNYLGVILSLANLNIKSDFALFEIGTNNFSEISKLTSIVRPTQIVITNIFPTHLEKLLNTRNVAKEKSDIFNRKHNPLVKLAILHNDNQDEQYIVKIAKKQKIKKIITFGNNNKNYLKIVKITNHNIKYSKVHINYGRKKISFLIKKDQIFRVENIIISLVFFIYNKIKLDLFFSITTKIPLIEGRGLKHKITINNKKINFIDESYNASPQTMKVCIDYFNKIKINKNNNKFLILGDMKELGEKTINFHENLLNNVSNKNFDYVIICGEFMKIALDKIKNKKILYMLSMYLILKFIREKIKNNDYLLIKGSNSSLTNKIAKKLLNTGEK